MLFEESGIAVDHEFVRFGSRAMRISEIKVVDTATRRVDGHVSPILWIFAGISLLLSFGAPVLFVFVVGLAGAAVYKQNNPKPLRHMLRVSTGGITNTHIYETTDGEQVVRLRRAIEQAMRPSTPSERKMNKSVPSVPRSQPTHQDRQPSGPWG